MTEFTVIDHPDGRWAIHLYEKQPDVIDNLINWFDNNIPEQCDIAYRFNSGNPYWNIAGGKHQRDVMTTILLTWG